MYINYIKIYIYIYIHTCITVLLVMLKRLKLVKKIIQIN